MKEYNNCYSYKKTLLLVFYFLFCFLDVFTQNTQTFSFSGSAQTFTIPSCVSSIQVKAWGGAGGAGGGDCKVVSITDDGGNGGGGAYVYSVLSVTPGQLLTIIIGGGGSAGISGSLNNGGGNGGWGNNILEGGNGGNAGGIDPAGGGGGGGGASAIYNGATPLLIAGGGGGGGGGSQYLGCSGITYTGGIGGGGGQDGGAIANCSSPGVKGMSNTTKGTIGTAGSNQCSGGGGGGGGYNGGTGGGSGAGTNSSACGGGGGNSYASGSSTVITIGNGRTPGNSSDPILPSGTALGGIGSSSTSGGNGYMVITWTCSTPTCTITLTGANSVCSGQSVLLQASGATSYTWSPATGLSSTTGATVTATPSVTTTYTVTSTNTTTQGPELVSNGDFSQGNTLFTTGYTYCNTYNCLNPLSNNGYSIAPNPAFVHNSFVGADHTTGNGNMMIFNGGISAPSWCQTVSVSSNTSYVFTVWVCSMYYLSPAQLDFSINGTSIGSITAPSSTGTWIKFTANWNSNTNTSANICIRDTNNAWNGNDFGLDDISLRSVTSASGCTGTAVSIVTVTVQPKPIVTSTSSLICAGSSIILNAYGANTYTWSPATNLSSINGASVTANPNNSTTYTVTGTGANGCVNTAFSVISVSTPTNNIKVNSPEICMGTSATLIASGASSYTWSTSTNLSSANGATVTVTPGVTTTYTVTSSTGCGSISEITTVTVNPKPSAMIISDSGCFSNTAILQGLYGSPPYTFTYQINGTTQSLSTNSSSPIVRFTPQNISNGSYACTLLSVKDANNCTSNVSGQVNSMTTLQIVPKPNPLFSIDPQLTNLYEPSVTITDISLGANTWLWDFGDGTISVSQNPGTHTYADTGTYKIKLLLSNSAGCKDSSYQYVTIKPPISLYIPNAFTPDEDGINDVFSPKGDFILKYEMNIYDRWGNHIFRTDDLNKGWDGIVKGGKDVSQIDTYIYVIDIRPMSNKHDYTYRGYFNLVR